MLRILCFVAISRLNTHFNISLLIEKLNNTFKFDETSHKLLNVYQICTFNMQEKTELRVGISKMFKPR